MKLNVGRLADLPTDRCRATEDGSTIVFRVGSEAKAFANNCLHQDAPLAGGWITDGIVACPFHFWRYHVADGQLVGSVAALVARPVTITDGEVWVEVPDRDIRSVREVMLDHARTWSREDAADDRT